MPVGVRALLRGGSIVVFMAAMLLASIPPAHAQTSVRVSAGFDGRFVPGARIPVRVTVTADRLVEGTLEVRYPREGEPVVRMPIEVSGGSVKEFVLVVPTRLDGTAPSQVVVTAGRDTTRQRIGELTTLSDQEVVAVSPRLLAGGPLPGPATLAAEAGTARFFHLDESLLAQAPESLESVTVIAVEAGDLEAFSPRVRAALMRWVSLGGELYIDAEAVPVGGIPEAWQPGPEGDVRAGAGRIRLTGTAMADGRWPTLVQPTVRAARTPGTFGEDGLMGDFNFEGGRLGFGGIPFFSESIAEAVATDAGLRAPRLGWLYGLLLVYVALAGPVTFFVLRRRRQAELAWLVVPALAVLFTVGGYAGGVGLRRHRVAHATILVTSPGGSTATTAAGTSGGGGTMSIGFPTDTTAAQLPVRMRRAPTYTIGRDGPKAELDLGPGEFALAAASGRVDVGDGLVVSARSEGDRISGTVTNSTPFELSAISVFVGKNFQQVGALAPGAEASFDVAASPIGDHWDMPGQKAWQQHNRFGNFEPVDESPVSYALWQAATSLPWGEPLSTGRVLVAGWTRDYTPTLRLGDRTVRPEGRTLVLAHGDVEYVSGPLDALDVRREEVRGKQFLGPEPGWDEVDGSSGPLVMRFTLPRPAEAELVLVAPVGLQSLDVWTGSAWRPVEVPQPEDPPRAVPATPMSSRCRTRSRCPTSSPNRTAGSSGAVPSSTRWVRSTAPSST
jgi:hypothetical protein